MFRGAWSRLPAWLQGLATLLTVLVIIGVMNGLTQAAGDHDPLAGLVVAWVFAALALGFIVYLARRSRRRLGSRRQFRLMRRALLSGHLPPDADARTWRPFLEKLAEGQRGTVWFYALFAIVILLVNVAGIRRLDDPSPGAIVLVVLLSAVVAGAWVGVPYLIQRRQLRHARQFLTQLPDVPPREM